MFGRRNGLGAQILFMVDPDILTTTGVVVIVYVAINATGFAIRVSDAAARRPHRLGLSGLPSGTTGSLVFPSRCI